MSKRHASIPVPYWQGHDPRVLSRSTDRLLVLALCLAEGKVVAVGQRGEHQELALDDATRGIRGTRCYLNLEQYAPSLAGRLAPARAKSAPADRVNLYVSPPGCGTPLHFDMRDVCIVQLFGRKTWSFADEPALDDPSSNCVFPDDASTVTHDGVVLQRPTELREQVLAPGDWLRIRKGVWHRTFSDVGSVSATLANLKPVSNTPVTPNENS